MPRGCARCNLLSRAGVDGQQFSWKDVVFDIAKATAIIDAVHRDPIEVPSAGAAEALLDPDLSISLRHVRHVDIRYPAIVVRRGGKWVFIDGNHRAFARMCRRLPIKAYLLTARETRAVTRKRQKS